MSRTAWTWARVIGSAAALTILVWRLGAGPFLDGVRTVDGQFTLKRLQYKIGEGEWSDTETVADDITVHFRFAISTR